MLKVIKNVIKEHKIIRGMMAYSLLWPCGSLIQQTAEGRNFNNYDWKKCLRFGVYGAFIIGPTLYMWMRVASTMWPRSDIKSSLAKAITEQFAYDPFAIACFLFTMSIYEDKTVMEAKTEVSEKFLETYKLGLVYWPIISTINFTFVPLHNQVVFAGIFSMIWTSFLAYMKHIDIHHLKQKKENAKKHGSFLAIFH